jgi:hypothetical protein
MSLEEGKVGQKEFKFALGDPVKDLVTSFEGIVVSRHDWLNNCNTYGIQPQTLKDGAPQDRFTFDEPQLSLVEGKENIITKKLKKKKKTGGPERKVVQPNRF